MAGLSAQADEIMRALQEADTAPGGQGGMRGVDIIAALEMDPTLTLDDVLSSRPDPQTLLGTGPAPRARGDILPVPLPDLPSRSPNAVEFGEGLQTQSRPEARELAADAGSAGRAALVTANVAAAHPVGRAISAIPRAVAAAPGLAAGAASIAGLTAGSAVAEAPGRDTSASASTLDRLIAQQEALTKQRTELTNERAKFTELSTPAQIRAAQERLNALGYDAGTPDGRPGGQWREALKRYNADRVRELQGITQQINGLEPQITDAQKQVRLDQRALEQEEGGRRLRDMENDVPIHRRALREYGPALGYALGLLGMGPLTRWGVTARANREAATTAARADAQMAPGATGSVPSRVGRVNQFWAEGNPRQVEPFASAPGRRPYPYTANSDVPAAGTLYQPNRAREHLENAGVAALGIADYALAQGVLIPRAEKEVREARDAVNETPNEVNIRLLQAALDMAAVYSAVGNAGLPMIAGYAGSSHFMPRNHVRPNVSAAEAERGMLDRLVNPPRTTAPSHPSQTRERIPRGQPGGGRFKGE